MDYTHYFTRPVRIDKRTYEQIRTAVNRMVDLLPVKRREGTYRGTPLVLRHGNGEDPLDLSQEIIFNGDGRTEDLDHEDFYFPRVVPRELVYRGAKTPRGYTFMCCKTARKPYDLAVCAALIIIKHYLGDRFCYSSDGKPTEESWPAARRLASMVLGQEVPVQFEHEITQPS